MAEMQKIKNCQINIFIGLKKYIYLYYTIN
jgi:hypothetical protein